MWKRITNTSKTIWKVENLDKGERRNPQQQGQEMISNPTSTRKEANDTPPQAINAWSLRSSLRSSWSSKFDKETNNRPQDALPPKQPSVESTPEPVRKKLTSWLTGGDQYIATRNNESQPLEDSSKRTMTKMSLMKYMFQQPVTTTTSDEIEMKSQPNKIKQWLLSVSPSVRSSKDTTSMPERKTSFQDLFTLSKEPKPPVQKEENRLAIPSASTSAFVERTKAQLEDLRKQAESSVALVKAREQVDLVKHQMVTRSVEMKDQAVVRSKEIIQQSRNASINYGKQKLEDASAVIKDQMTKVKQTPVEIARNVRATSDHIAMKSVAQARKARNFMVGVFIGGCFAFGLGLGLGSGGWRWRTDRDP